MVDEIGRLLPANVALEFSLDCESEVVIEEVLINVDND
jgi:hypothetical protein